MKWCERPRAIPKRLLFEADPANRARVCFQAASPSWVRNYQIENVLCGGARVFSLTKLIAGRFGPVRSSAPSYDHNTGTWIAHRFIVAVLEKAPLHNPAFSHAYVLVVLTAEGAGNDCRCAVSR